MTAQNQMNKEELLAAIQAADSLIRQYKYNKFETYFTDTGKNSRHNYPKQMDLMRAGKNHNIRAFIGGNGSGKSVMLAYETYLHMSGKYPKWWDGHRFTRPISTWLCGMDAKALRSGLQEILFGGIGDEDFGTGMIPREEMTHDNGKIQKWAMQGTANCIGQFRVKHYTDGIFDGWSTCEFMTYEQGWQSFQGPTKQWIGFDEEPDDGKIFAECIARLRGKDGDPMGHFMAAFTPTDGFRDVYLAFVPNGEYPQHGMHPEDPSKYTARVGWGDAPHLSEEWKRAAIAQWKLTDPNNIEARTEGYASAGSGKIYPVDQEYVTCPTFEIPDHWPRAFGLDFASPNGWTAVVWMTQDPNTKVKYIYSEYKRTKAIDEIHIESIKSKGKWIPGAHDPHSGTRDNGATRAQYYRSKGLNIIPGNNAIIAGIASLLSQFETGSLKIMDHCTELLKEYRLYRYDKKDSNKPARDQNDHLLDALRYVDSKFEWIARSLSDEEETEFDRPTRGTSSRDNTTGY